MIQVAWSIMEGVVLDVSQPITSQPIKHVNYYRLTVFNPTPMGNASIVPLAMKSKINNALKK